MYILLMEIALSHVHYTIYVHHHDATIATIHDIIVVISTTILVITIDNIKQESNAIIDQLCMCN